MRAPVVLAFAVVLAACAAEPPAPASAPPLQASVVATAAPPPPSRFWVIPNAEASPRSSTRPEPVDPEPLRSDGKRHALDRTKDGLVVISEVDGVLGLLRGPDGAEIAWAGFVDDDAILVAGRGALFRAGSPADALAGRLDRIALLDPAARLDRMASAGSWVVAATRGADTPLLVSKDSGKSFAPMPRPAGVLLDLAVRVDGAIVIALEKEAVTGEYDKRGRRAQIHVRRGGAWARGPLAEAYYGRLIDHFGDAITVDARAKLDDPASLRVLGLTQAGSWSPAETEVEWPARTFTQDWFFTSAPVKRPGFAIPFTGQHDGLLGGLGMGSPCTGPSCLKLRHLTDVPGRVHAFLDGRCGPEGVKVKTETIRLEEEPGHPAHDVKHSFSVCADDAPAVRGSALLLLGDGAPRIGRLPLSCPEGRIVGSDRAAYAVCSSKHRGRPSIQFIGPSGALTEVMTLGPEELELAGAEAVSDATTIIVAKGEAPSFLCRADARCTKVAPERFLTARPLPGRRALVARAAADGAKIELRVEGDAPSTAITIAPPGNAIDLEVTADGRVRLWTSATLTTLSPSAWLAKTRGYPDAQAFFVGAAGDLLPDAEGRAARFREIDSLRGKR